MSVAREQAFWQAQAGLLDEAGLRRESGFVAREPLWRWALAQVARLAPQRVLDAGCGRGSTSLLLAAPGRRVVGVDVAAGALADARRLTARLEPRPGFVAAALEELPFAAGSFDLVAGRFVLHHAASLERAAAELARVLRPGGAGVFVETWGRNPLLRLGRAVAQRLGVGLGTPDERPLSGADLRALARSFEVEASFPVFCAFELSNRLLRRGQGLARRSSLARSLLVRAWTGAIRLDRAIERRCPRAAAWGWYVGLVLRRRG